MDERYPIGQFEYSGDPSSTVIKGWIEEVERMPAALRTAIAGLDEEQLNTPYRVGGWTVRQVVHHLADSHINAYTRFKLALTEENPTILPYDQQKWAELADSQLPIDVSLQLIDALHERWVSLLRSLSPADLEKVFIHPEIGQVKLGWNIGNYAWHGKHHVAHITSLRVRKGW
ncbi:putative metal-dependent hydrolase [Alkalihalobacillus oceani]|uniref:YfiT family bacillithiol transferase n=1 Tax=Halalkalibacter oceani TaxID=1653776 RepID=UPI00203F67CA|nr:putative metal-dependent hydrolase [Halalkalibacter oceani]MCM3759569.1 putative metal-dependent hydrolase [Halalkalibacter oceani]